MHARAVFALFKAVVELYARRLAASQLLAYSLLPGTVRGVVGFLKGAHG